MEFKKLLKYAALASYITITTGLAVYGVTNRKQELEEVRNMVPISANFVPPDYEDGDLNHDGLFPDLLVYDRNNYSRPMFKQKNGTYLSIEAIEKKKKLYDETEKSIYKSIEDKLKSIDDKLNEGK